MKKNLFRLLFLSIIGFTMVSCSNPSKMAQRASEVTTECNPQVLEAVAGNITANYTMNFPPKYFLKKAILEVTPVLVYDGGEVAAPMQTIQGEAILDNNQVVNYAQGGKVSNSVTFKYAPGMEKARLELRPTVYNKSKTKHYKFPISYKLADGTNTTYMLVETDGAVAFEKDNYQKTIAESKEAQILYQIDQSKVRDKELKNNSIKEFEKYLNKLAKDERRTLKSNDIIAYASPDGPWDLNQNLSDNRAKTADKAFAKTIAKKTIAKDAPTNVSQVAEDWDGFKEMVEASDIQDKDLILRVLSMYSDPAVREREIKNISSIFDALKTQVLPQLRRARFIANVEYQNYTDEELNKMIKENSDDLDEEALLYSAKLVKGNDAKINLYKKAGEKYNSSRAYNNMAALYLKDGKPAEAKKALNNVSDKNGNYYNNLGVAAMQNGDYTQAAECFAKSDTKEAKENAGALYILNGEYQKAAAALENAEGCTAFNAALANILLKNEAKAESYLKGACPCKSYLKAIIAARRGNSADAKKYLEIAKKDKKFANRIANDIEFAKL